MTEAATSGGTGELRRGIPLIDPLHPTTSLKLVTNAVRKGWPVPDEAKAEAVRAARAIIASTDDDPRAVVAAVKALVEMDRINQTDHWNQDRNDRLDAGKPTEIHAAVAVDVPQMPAADVEQVEVIDVPALPAPDDDQGKPSE